MKIPLLVCLVMATSACLHKPKPVTPNNTNDTIQPLVDTAMIPTSYMEADHIKDSLQFLHERDSFLAIKPLATFITDKKGDAFDKLIAAVIDTSDVTKISLPVTDTTIIKYDKDQMPVSSRHICKNKRFTIELFDSKYNSYAPKKLFINGHELRAGIEIDTSLSGSDYINYIEIRPESPALMTFGAKEYFFFTGSILSCTGRACSVLFYILYDPVIKKALLLPQYRSDLITGYDKKINSPVFINMLGSWDDETYSHGYTITGKLYRFDNNGKIKPVPGKKGKQFYFDGYTTYANDTLVINDGNLPTHCQVYPQHVLP